MTAAALLSATALLFAGTPAASGATNTPPATPSGLYSDPGGPCATTAPGTFVRGDEITVFHATATDPDPGQELTANWELWSADDPTLRRELDWGVVDGHAYAQFDHSGLPSDRTYAWRLRISDGTATSDWSPTCYYTPDSVRPEIPAVKSAVYLSGDQWEPRGGIGVPGEFTFSPNGSTDVARYEYYFPRHGQNGPDPIPWTSVPADPVTGSATITWAPPETGLFSAVVRAIDRANNYSWDQSATFTVRDIRPHVWSNLYPDQTTNPEGNIGVPGVFEFSPGLPDTTSYTYRLEDTSEQTVAAGADGKAQVTLAPSHGGENVLYVRNTGLDGTVSLDREYRFQVDTAPVIEYGGPVQIGTPVQFTLTPRLAGTTSYTYWFTTDHDQPIGDRVTIPARPDGGAEFSWVPPSSASTFLRVQSANDDVISEIRVQHLYIDGVAPYISRTGADSPGVPGTFTLRSPMRDITEYVYWFSFDPDTKLTVPARPDGSAEFDWTPAKGGSFWLTARARNATGLLSNEGGTSLTVDDSPIVTSAEFHRWPASPMHQGTFHLASRLPGTVAYEFTVDGVTTALAAGADGTATTPYTPTWPGFHTATVRAKAADGTHSGHAYYSFTVTDAPLVTSAEYPGGDSGGPGIEGTFIFSPATDGMTAYTYRVNDLSGGTSTPEVTVPADQAGNAAVTWTPAHGGSYSLTVTGTRADGGSTEERYYPFSVRYSG
ncbi:hypothetical protein L3Q67_38950 [Saccharothrix sp. AJ9571]|nr:hypothetical protein L3Q67_38950 [Saccharothrix sp. AJ9571]